MAEVEDVLAYWFDDIPMQFKGKKKIKILHDAFARQLQEVKDFLLELDVNRRIETAEGEQLDRIGDIVCLTRAQAGLYTGDPIPVNVLDDKTYRKFLKYKILLNTSYCTYDELIKGLNYFFIDYNIYYMEDPEWPATIVFKVPSEVGSVLTETPIIKAAGVGYRIIVFDSENDIGHKMFFGYFDNQEITIPYSTNGSGKIADGVLMLDSNDEYYVENDTLHTIPADSMNGDILNISDPDITQGG